MKTYKIIRDTIEAFQYNGTEESAKEIEKNYVGVYTEYDNEGVFIGLRATFKNDKGRYDFVQAGDYLVLIGVCGLECIPKKEFEYTYKVY